MAKFSRREFLSKTGKAALGIGIASQLGFLAGCDDMSRGPSEAAWRQFADSLQGMLLRPGDELYSQLALPHNLAFTGIMPQGIVLAAVPADVQESVRFVREHDLPVAVRSGNHSYAAYSSTSGLQIDVTGLSAIDINESDGVVNIGSGVQLGSLEAALAPAGVVIPGGTCTTVGIAGLLLGGGLGYNGRKYGLTSDNLVQTQIVTADGEFLNCNDTENTALYWASRGGGGGNFGINVAFQVQSYPVSPVSVFELEWDAEDALAVWLAMQEIAITASDDFSMKLGVTIKEQGPLPGSRNLTISTAGQYYGPASELREILDPAFMAAEPASSTIEYLSFAEATQFLQEQGSPNAFLTKSAFIEGTLPDQAVEMMLAHFAGWPADSRVAEFKVFAWGGAYNAISPTATAFVHRSADFAVESCASWHVGDSQSIIDASEDWIQELFEIMGPFFNGSAYQNFIDPTLVNWQEAYYGENFPFLVDVKRMVDPDNIFNFAQSIPLNP